MTLSSSSCLYRFCLRHPVAPIAPLAVRERRGYISPRYLSAHTKQSLLHIPWLRTLLTSVRPGFVHLLFTWRSFTWERRVVVGLCFIVVLLA
ncbi:unnamed protein product [Somion occarium]|uniref:Uncharacterized protein n=1 Tax=Somion occarium TaxID=3059160 RepID=A0ABP1DPX9_9APHY